MDRCLGRFQESVYLDLPHTHKKKSHESGVLILSQILEDGLSRLRVTMAYEGLLPENLKPAKP